MFAKHLPTLGPQRGVASHTGLAMVAMVCYLLQQLLMPLHCVLHEHHVGGSSHHAHCAQLGADGHASAHEVGDHDHAHGHQHESDSPSEEHAPHPIDDHLSEQVERLVLRTTLDPPTLAWFRAPSPWCPPTTWTAIAPSPELARPIPIARDLDPARGPPSTV